MELRNSEGGLGCVEEWETGKMSEQPKALNFQLNKTSNISQLEFCILYSLRKVIFASFCWQNQESVLQAHQAQCIPSNSIMFHRTCLYLKSKLNPVESTCQQYLYVSSALAGPCQGSCQGSGSHFIGPSAVERIQQYLRCTHNSNSTWTFGRRLWGRNGKFRMKQNMSGRNYTTTPLVAELPQRSFDFGWFWTIFYRPPLLTNIIYLHKDHKHHPVYGLGSGYFPSSIHDLRIYSSIAS